MAASDPVTPREDRISPEPLEVRLNWALLASLTRPRWWAPEGTEAADLKAKLLVVTPPGEAEEVAAELQRRTAERGSLLAARSLYADVISGAYPLPAEDEGKPK